MHIGGRMLTARQEFPPGSPQRPPSGEELARKVRDCLADTGLGVADVGWSTDAGILREHL